MVWLGSRESAQHGVIADGRASRSEAVATVALGGLPAAIMSEWTHANYPVAMKKFPYGRQDERRLYHGETIKLSHRTNHSHKRDHRRPIQHWRDGWPECGEPILRAPLGPPSPRVPLDGVIAGGKPTPAWLAKVNAAVWRKDERKDVNPERAASARGARGAPVIPPKVEKDVRAVNKEAERSGPYVGFFLQRPLERKSTEEKLPQARREALRVYQQTRARALKVETQVINETVDWNERWLIGLSPRGTKQQAADPHDTTFMTAIDKRYHTPSAAAAASPGTPAPAAAAGGAQRKRPQSGPAPGRRYYQNPETAPLSDIQRRMSEAPPGYVKWV